MLLFGVPSCFRPVTTMLLFGVLLSICLVYAIMLLFGVCYHAIRCTLSCFYLVYKIMLLFGLHNHVFMVYEIMLLFGVWYLLFASIDLTIYWDMSPMLRGALSSESTTALLAFYLLLRTHT